MSQERPADQSDAELILRLYELRREPEMRKARDWCNMQFNPQTLQELLAVVSAAGSDENRHLRQVLSYWEMVAALVNRGLIHQELFEETNGEYLNIYCKLKPHLPELRRMFDFPEYLGQLEKLAEGSERGRARLAMFEKWFKQRREAQAKAS